jgi:hypothetical protein
MNKLPQNGFAPIALIALSAIAMAVVFTIIGFKGSFFPQNPAPSPNIVDSIDSGDSSEPVLAGVEDTEVCDDEFNADCDDLEGDDVNPADLAGPD